MRVQIIYLGDDEPARRKPAFVFIAPAAAPGSHPPPAPLVRVADPDEEIPAARVRWILPPANHPIAGAHSAPAPLVRVADPDEEIPAARVRWILVPGNPAAPVVRPPALLKHFTEEEIPITPRVVAWLPIVPVNPPPVANVRSPGSAYWWWWGPGSAAAAAFHLQDLHEPEKTE